MNGPEHYAAAENHLAYVEALAENAVLGRRAELFVGLAQAHATLALAAATASARTYWNGPDSVTTYPDQYEVWLTVLKERDS